MDDFGITPQLLQASHHLPLPETGSPPGLDVMLGDYAPWYPASDDHGSLNDSMLSQFDQLERLLRSPTLVNHVDYGKPSVDLALLGDPQGTFSSAELMGMISPPLPGPTSPSTPGRDSQAPASNSVPSSLAKSASAAGSNSRTMDRSEEVKQLRKKYHEKYKERNRLAAGRSRQKQVDLIELLQAEQQEEERRRKALEEEIAKIQKELVDMKQALQHHIRISNCMTIMSHGTHLQTLGLLAPNVLR